MGILGRLRFLTHEGNTAGKVRIAGGGVGILARVGYNRETRDIAANLND